MLVEAHALPNLLEAILLAAGKPMSEEQLLAVFVEDQKPTLAVLRQALQTLKESLTDRGVELVQVASGYRFQIKSEWVSWVSKLWEEKATRYSRALLETLALIAYRQPITRGEIEDIRGVAVSTSIIKTLLEDREWVRVVGHRDVPGRPALYATTKLFLDYFGLKNLQDLPALPEIMNLDLMTQELDAALPQESLSIDDSSDVEMLEVPEAAEETEETEEIIEIIEEPTDE